jgi:hypothetical protein
MQATNEANGNTAVFNYILAPAREIRQACIFPVVLVEEQTAALV